MEESNGVDKKVAQANQKCSEMTDWAFDVLGELNGCKIQERNGSNKKVDQTNKKRAEMTD